MCPEIRAGNIWEGPEIIIGTLKGNNLKKLQIWPIVNEQGYCNNKKEERLSDF